MSNIESAKKRLFSEDSDEEVVVYQLSEDGQRLEIINNNQDANSREESPAPELSPRTAALFDEIDIYSPQPTSNEEDINHVEEIDAGLYWLDMI